MTMTNGYPPESDIDTFLSDRGIENIPENDDNFMQELKQFVYGILNATDHTLALGVWCPSSTTFNVWGGRYLFNGEAKTYTAGSAVDPTDNTNDITNTVTVTGTDKTINRAGTIDDSKYEIAANGSLSVVGDGANADVEVYIQAIRVS